MNSYLAICKFLSVFTLTSLIAFPTLAQDSGVCLTCQTSPIGKAERELIRIGLSVGLRAQGMKNEAADLRDKFEVALPLKPVDVLKSPRWSCTHHNAFENDNHTERGVTLEFARKADGGSKIINRGNFVFRNLEFSEDGLAGTQDIPEYQGIELFALLRKTRDGDIVGEVSLDPDKLEKLAEHYKHRAYVPSSSLVHSERTVFYYTTCKPAR